MQMAIDASLVMQVLTLGCAALGAWMSTRSRAEAAELRLWVEEQLRFYRRREDCTREMDAHGENIAEVRSYFTQWRPNSAPPTDKR